MCRSATLGRRVVAAVRTENRSGTSCVLVVGGVGFGYPLSECPAAHRGTDLPVVCGVGLRPSLSLAERARLVAKVRGRFHARRPYTCLTLTEQINLEWLAFFRGASSNA
jgi:hypothetical protein